MTPRATYRLQLSRDFTFDDAAGIVPYLAGLGVSHVYCSPVLQAAAGSTHGYDVIDPTRLDEELGGEDGFQRLVEAARRHSMELLIDIVPNHMATAGRANPWWWDLLEHGTASRYAKYFDIDWDPATSPIKDKVLLGVLGDRYGRELDAGAFRLDRESAGVVLRYHEHAFPISDLDRADGNIEDIEKDADLLDALLQRQHYRLAYWRTAQEEVNYRRFFTIDSLIGLRVENESVFDSAHSTILRLVDSADVTGLRIDYIDGLRDPDGYLRRLRARVPGAYVVVEKILASHEQLPGAWPVQGTTGYDFIAAVDGLFVETENEAAMTALYHGFTGESQAFAEVARASKLHAVSNELAPDLERLVTLLVQICEFDWRHRDRTRRELKDALLEVAIAFPVYRTYVTAAPASDQDQAAVQAAVDEAARRNPEVDPELLGLVRDILLRNRSDPTSAELAARFQQLTPAVTAKGIEDTAFYRYNRLVSLNEVGGDPATFGFGPERFHDRCARAASAWPHGMATLSTHDTKRSGDVRARIDVLSEMPAEWDRAVHGWAEHNERYRTQGYPDRNLEYLLYQSLVGAWPIDANRLGAFLLKSAREAKMHTSWSTPVATYEDALNNFVASILSDAEFMTDVESFLGRTQLVALGRLTSLAQTTLQLTAPAVPDLYQGSELWNLALVDPDNRRPVDYSFRTRLLDEIAESSAADAMTRSDEGAPKLWLIHRLLTERGRRPELFASTNYARVPITGVKARHALSFKRDGLVVLVPRLVAQLGAEWGDTAVELPHGRWCNVLTDDIVAGGAVPVGEVLGQFPVAVLVQEPA